VVHAEAVPWAVGIGAAVGGAVPAREGAGSTRSALALAPRGAGRTDRRVATGPIADAAAAAQASVARGIPRTALLSVAPALLGAADAADAVEVAGTLVALATRDPLLTTGRHAADAVVTAQAAGAGDLPVTALLSVGTAV